MSNENSGNVLPSDYCCHLFDFAKLAKIYKFRFANSWFDSPMANANGNPVRVSLGLGSEFGLGL